MLTISFLEGIEDARTSLANNSPAREAIDNGSPHGISHLDADRGPSVQVLPLGDSITQANDKHSSYRYPLWIKLIDSEVNLDFVGSQSSNHNGDPVWPEYKGHSFDRDHEGHWGWRTEQILEGLPMWLEGYTPGLVLLHIGTNDAFANQSTASTVKEIKRIIDILRYRNPTITVLLAQVIPTRDPTSNQRIKELNEQIDGIAASKSTTESLVVVVDQNSGFSPSSDTYDGVHPNIAGEEKIAQKWFDAIVETLPKS
jgi:lysophospholipase L1-like esterase